MRTVPLAKSARTFAWRNLLLAIVVILMAMVGLALLTDALTHGSGTVYLANIAAPQRGLSLTGPSIVVTGSGRAAAPADRVHVQLLITGSDSNYGSRRFQPTPSATTEAGDHERVAAIVDALRARKVSEDAIAIYDSPAFARGYCYSPDGECVSTRIDFMVEQPKIEDLNAMVNAADEAATGSGMSIDFVGASYRAADCATLQQKARDLATKDARARAASQAANLGVELGDLLMSSESTSAGGASGSDDCATPHIADNQLNSSIAALGGTLPSFNPAGPAEAAAEVQITLTYAIPKVDQMS
jgi:uncharacterized protein YggE